MSTTEIKTSFTPGDLKDITTPSVIYVLQTIRAIRRRTKDEDCQGLDYAAIYQKLAEEFKTFYDRYPKIFTRVIQNKNLDIVVANLYYKDKVERGLMTEAQLSDMLAKKYMPSHLKEEADKRIAEMQKEANTEV